MPTRGSRAPAVIARAGGRDRAAADAADRLYARAAGGIAALPRACRPAISCRAAALRRDRPRGPRGAARHRLASRGRRAGAQGAPAGAVVAAPPRAPTCGAARRRCRRRGFSSKRSRAPVRRRCAAGRRRDPVVEPGARATWPRALRARSNAASRRRARVARLTRRSVVDGSDARSGRAAARPGRRARSRHLAARCRLRREQRATATKSEAIGLLTRPAIATIERNGERPSARCARHPERQQRLHPARPEAVERQALVHGDDRLAEHCARDERARIERRVLQRAQTLGACPASARAARATRQPVGGSARRRRRREWLACRRAWSHRQRDRVRPPSRRYTS